jgi:hypothetical protein
MNQATIEKFEKDERTGVITGGYSEGPGFRITWQDGPLIDPITEQPLGQNGAFLQTVLGVCIRRLAAFQESPMRSRENAVALTHLETALLWLNKREEERKERGVVGTHRP